MIGALFALAVLNATPTASACVPKDFFFYFQPGTGEIRAGQEEELGKLAEVGRRPDTARLDVFAYTTVDVPIDEGQRLGAMRASAITDALVRDGVDPDKLWVKVVGASPQPRIGWNSPHSLTDSLLGNYTAVTVTFTDADGDLVDGCGRKIPVSREEPQ